MIARPAVVLAALLAACRAGEAAAQPAAAPSRMPGLEIPAQSVSPPEGRIRHLTDAINSVRFFALYGPPVALAPGQVIAVRFNDRIFETISGPQFPREGGVRITSILARELCSAPTDRTPVRSPGDPAVDRQLNADRRGASESVRRAIPVALRRAGGRDVRMTALASTHVSYTLEDLQAIRAAALVQPACAERIRAALSDSHWGVVCIVRGVMTAHFTVRLRGDPTNAALRPDAVLELPDIDTRFTITGATATQVQGSAAIGAVLGPTCWNNR